MNDRIPDVGWPILASHFFARVSVHSSATQRSGPSQPKRPGLKSGSSGRRTLIEHSLMQDNSSFNIMHHLRLDELSIFFLNFIYFCEPLLCKMLSLCYSASFSYCSSLLLFLSRQIERFTPLYMRFQSIRKSSILHIEM